jgi:hypothetical protein
VLSTPTVDRAAAVEAHRHLAALRLLLGEEATARRHAEAAVAFDPAASTPEGAPPALEDLLAEARARFGGRAADVTIELVDDPRKASVRAAVLPYADALAEEIGLRCVRGAATVEESGALPEVRVRIPPEESSSTVHCRAWLAGRGGAHLIESSAQLRAPPSLAPTPAGAAASSADGPLGPESPRAPEDEDHDDGGGAPWLAIGVGAGALAVLAIVAVLVLAGGEDGARLGAPRAEEW